MSSILPEKSASWLSALSSVVNWWLAGAAALHENTLSISSFFQFTLLPSAPSTVLVADRLPEMTEDEMIALLATDGMLVKRPMVVLEDRVLVGFKEADWAEALGK